MKKFGERLREIRKERGMTGEQLAQALGVSRRALTNYEAGEREPNFDQLTVLSNLLGVTVDYLIGRSDDPTGAVADADDGDHTLPLSPEEQARLKKLLEDPDMHIAFRKGVLGKQANPRRLLKTLELLAMDDGDEE